MRSAMLYAVRPNLMLLSTAMIVLLAGCSAPPADKPKVDPTADASYTRGVEELAGMGRQAEELLRAGKTDQAAAVVSAGQPLLDHLLAAPRPTLAAMEAISDFDQIYGRLLVGNGYFGEARLQFQKNVTRWKVWKPQSPETERRLQLARDAVAECDRHMHQ
jgi:hypothetical protein